MAHLCEEHDLVLANDGKCVLCRRAQRRYLNLEPRPPSAADRVLTAALATGLLAALGMLLWALQLPQLDSAPRYADAASARLPRTPDPSAPPPEGGALTAARVDADGAADGDQANPIRSALGTGPAPGEPSARSQHENRALQAAQRAVEEAKRSVPITMYSTSWCTICETSRYYMLGRELAYTEHDIEQDAAAAKRVAKLNPARSVPTFVIDGEVLVGFNAWQLESTLEKAAQKRVAAQPGAACKAESSTCDGDDTATARR